MEMGDPLALGCNICLLMIMMMMTMVVLEPEQGVMHQGAMREHRAIIFEHNDRQRNSLRVRTDGRADERTDSRRGSERKIRALVAIVCKYKYESLRSFTFGSLPPRAGNRGGSHLIRVESRTPLYSMALPSEVSLLLLLRSQPGATSYYSSPTVVAVLGVSEIDEKNAASERYCTIIPVASVLTVGGSDCSP